VAWLVPVGAIRTMQIDPVETLRQDRRQKNGDTSLPAGRIQAIGWGSWCRSNNESVARVRICPAPRYFERKPAATTTGFRRANLAMSSFSTGDRGNSQPRLSLDTLERK
jgi:hypothetical protein